MSYIVDVAKTMSGEILKKLECYFWMLVNSVPASPISLPNGKIDMEPNNSNDLNSQLGSKELIANLRSKMVDNSTAELLESGDPSTRHIFIVTLTKTPEYIGELRLNSEDEFSKYKERECSANSRVEMRKKLIEQRKANNSLYRKSTLDTIGKELQIISDGANSLTDKVIARGTINQILEILPNPSVALVQLDQKIGIDDPVVSEKINL